MKYLSICFSFYYHSSFSKPFFRFSYATSSSPTSQLILQPFRRFTYVTAHSATLPLLHLRNSSFSNPSFASPTSQALSSPGEPPMEHLLEQIQNMLSYFQNIHLWNWDICYIVWPTFVSCVIEACRLGLEPLWHSSTPLCHSELADTDQTGISWDVRKDGVGQVAQEARRWATGWMARVWSRVSEGVEIFLRFFVSRLVLRFTQPPIKWVPGASLGGKGGRA